MSVLSRTAIARLASLVAVSAALSAAMLVAVANPAAASEESSNLSAINSARAQHGLKSLSMSSSLQSVARRWSQHMASGGCGSAAICHNPSLTSQVSGWQKIGENVGVGPTGSAIQSAFMNSSAHRANILDPAYTLVGIGTAKGADGRLYITQDFEKPMGGGGSSPAAAPKKVPHATARPHAAVPPTRNARTATTRRIAPHQATNSFAARLRILAARPAVVADPVTQAMTFHTTMASLTA